MMSSTVHPLPSLVNRSSVCSMCCNPLSNHFEISLAVRRGLIILLSVGSFHWSSPLVVCLYRQTSRSSWNFTPFSNEMSSTSL